MKERKVKSMKHKTLICAIIIAIGVIGVVGFIILGSSGGRNNDPIDPATTSDIEVNVQTPPVTGDPSVVPPVTDNPVTTEPSTTETPFNPDDPVGNGDIAPDEVPDPDSKVKVDTNTIEEDNKEIPAVPVVIVDDKIEQTEKNKDEEKTGNIADDHEIINDSVIEKKEDEQRKKDEEDNKGDKPATPVSEEKTIGDEEDKPVSFGGDTEEKSEDAGNNGNAPVYVNPAQGGENPFEGGGDSEIDDHSSDEFVDGGGDKPGEGIHF